MIPVRLVVLADADNTLWDTDSVYADAQLALLSEVELAVGAECKTSDRLGFVRSYDQALASRHHLHLKYPAQMLVAALAAGLAGEPPKQTAAAMLAGRDTPWLPSQEAIKRAVENYMTALSRTPSLLPSVREGLVQSYDAAVTMYVMTEGRAERQRSFINKHALQTYFADVWELTKTKSQFDRMRRRFHDATVVVIGDQPDRDIVPAHEAGCMTALVPSRFRPEWHSDAELSVADFVAKNFLDAISWALSLRPAHAKA